MISYNMHHFKTCRGSLIGLLGLLGILMQAPQAKAQDDALAILAGGTEDANKLLVAYMSPMGQGFSMALGQNWFNTANALKTLRFNVQAGVTMIQIPDQHKFFDPATLQLTTLKADGDNPNAVPTIAADRSAVSPKWIVTGTIQDSSIPGGVLSINYPAMGNIFQGLGLSMTFAPYIQANIGLVKNTELSIRYAPTLDLSTLGNGIIPENILSGKINFWGLGLKHELLQWIPVVKVLPFSLSLYANHSRMSYELDTRIEPSDFTNYSVEGIQVTNRTISGSQDFSKQQLFMEGRATGLGIVLSKKILAFTPYASIGLQNSSFSLAAKGNYAVRSGLTPSPNNPANLTEEWTSLSNPLDIQIDSEQQLRMGLGLRFKLVLIALHAEAFTLGDFKGYSAGLSLGF
ncbi:MAG: hypothetical protein FJ350_06935 [Sphingomonadales bacterium]|nr:hypothetical protein [Sphingomonadales bacterium]